MSFFEAGFEKVSALCIGATALACTIASNGQTQLLPGTVEMVTSAAALTGLVLKNHATLSTERPRVSRQIRHRIKSKYAALIGEDGGERSAESALWQADQALQSALALISLDRQRLSQAAVSGAGFVPAMVAHVMDEIAKTDAARFGPAQKGQLAHAYAQDLLEAGFEAAVGNADYYRQLEPAIALSVAQTVGQIRDQQQQMIKLVTEALLPRTGKGDGPRPIQDERDDDHFSAPIVAQLREFGVTVDRLTAEQYGILSNLHQFKRARVDGCAGSGKTLVACEKASRLAAAGLRTLVLCHNPLLAAHMRALLASSGAVVSSFTAFVEMLSQIDSAPSGAEQWTIYDEPHDQSLGRAFDLVASGYELFDAVVVDEGQDFKPEWWLLVEALLRNQDESQLYIFHDDNQSLHAGRGHYPIAIPPVWITRNCRNAGAILAVMGRFYPNPPAADEALRQAGFVEHAPAGGGDYGTVLRDAVGRALNLGFEPRQLLVVTLGEVAPYIPPMLEVQPNAGWQRAVRSLIAEAARDREPEYFEVHSAHEIEAKLQLSEEARPTAEDIDTVRRVVEQHFHVLPAARRHIEGHQGAFRAKWLIEMGEPALKLRQPQARRGIQIVAHFERDTWSGSLPAPRQVRLIGEADRRSPEDLPVLHVGAAKGLEAEVVILLVGQHLPISRAEKYIATSRGRFGLIIADPANRLGLH